MVPRVARSEEHAAPSLFAGCPSSLVVGVDSGVVASDVDRPTGVT